MKQNEERELSEQIQVWKSANSIIDWETLKIPYIIKEVLKLEKEIEKLKLENERLVKKGKIDSRQVGDNWKQMKLEELENRVVRLEQQNEELKNKRDQTPIETASAVFYFRPL